jgi:nickel/cobalt transporter (NicO) family protein
MIDLLPFGTAFLLGFVHAVDVDHAVAVSAYVSTRPSLPAAARFGFRWAAGHSLTVLAAGGLLLALGLRWPEGLDRWAEGAVGVMLVGVGLWAARALQRLHLHRPPAHGDHAHLHVHPAADRPHDHRHGPGHRDRHHHPRGIALVGMLHGLAGTSGVLALVPVSLIDSRALGAAYLALFCAGVVAGMVLFAGVVAFALGRAAERSVAWGRRFAQAVALTSVVVGVVWVARAAA